MANWDVIVIGLGGVGSAAAYHLATRGLRVLGLDQFPPVHDRGSSHGKLRIIRQAYFEHPSYVPLLRRAYQLWDKLESAAGRQLFFRTGLVEIGPKNGIVIPGILKSAADHDLEIEQHSCQEIARRWPGLCGDEQSVAVIERNAGFLRVEDCVAAHLAVAHAAGASCVHGVKMTRWQVDGDSIMVNTDQGVERSARLLIAGGPWSSVLLDAVGIPLQVVRKYQYWFRPRDNEIGRHSTLEDGFPCFFHETVDGFFYGFPTVDDDGIKVARHSGGRNIEGPTTEHCDDPEDRRLVDQYVNDCVPAASDVLSRSSGCYYTQTPDEHFVIDRHPDHPQVSFVAGLSGHGFKFTSVLGELASQMVTDSPIELDIDLFSRGRFDV